VLADPNYGSYELELSFNIKQSIMKKPKLTSIQIVAAIKKQESGISTKVVSRELGISKATFYNLEVPVTQDGSQ